jgi:hypothetical protein
MLITNEGDKHGGCIVALSKGKHCSQLCCIG